VRPGIALARFEASIERKRPSAWIASFSAFFAVFTSLPAQTAYAFRSAPLALASWLRSAAARGVPPSSVRRASATSASRHSIDAKVDPMAIDAHGSGSVVVVVDGIGGLVVLVVGSVVTGAVDVLVDVVGAGAVDEVLLVDVLVVAPGSVVEVVLVEDDVVDVEVLVVELVEEVVG